MMAYGQDIEPQEVVPKPQPVKYKNVDRFDECKFHDGVFITARVRSTTGRYCFHRCLSVHRGGGQPAHSAGGGGSVVSPAGVGGQPAGGWVSPGGGGSAKIGQQNEYLLHGGRYASCVHAGGLSCLFIYLFIFLSDQFQGQ